MTSNTSDIFLLSKKKKLTGSRRQAREKAMQVLMAYEISETPWELIFSHVFFRKFNLGEDEEKLEKLLTPDEIYELEADIPIEWNDDEILFARTIIKYTIELKSKIDELIKQYAKNWELDRIALIDRVLMQMAAVEILKFPDIPTKVSINEAIDIAKKYSTPKSGIFINGILDSVHEQLENEGLINKTGKGLVDNKE